MDAFATSWPPPLARAAFGPFPYDAGGAPMKMHTNPFTFGLDIALPVPTRSTPMAFPDADDNTTHNTLHGNPFGFGSDPNTSNPFSYGFGFAHPPDPPPFTGYYDPYCYGNPTTHSHSHAQYRNPFAVDAGLDGLPPSTMFVDPSSSTGANTYTEPTYLINNNYALAPVPASDSFSANDVTTLSMLVPAPWEWEDLHNASRIVQPSIDEPESPQPLMVPTSSTCKDSSTAQLCASYGNDDIESTLRAYEEDTKARPSPNYLNTTQGGRMSPEMRTDLVCWMIRMCQHYDLGAGTLHRAVSYVDKFLTLRPLAGADVDAYHLKLLGAAAVFAAAKYEDQGTRHKLGASEIAKYGEFATGKVVVDMERALLTGIGYRLGGPTAHTFVEHFFCTRGGYDNDSHVEGDDVETDEELLRVRARGLADVSLLHYGCLELKPSAVAAAAMFLARVMLKPSYGEMRKWNKEIKEVTGYKPKDLERGVDAIRSLIPKDDGNGNGFDIDIFPVFYADPD